MEFELKKRILQLHDQTKLGIFGTEAQSKAKEYKQLEHQGVAVFLKFITEFYNKPRNTEEDKLMADLADSFIQLMIVVYRDAKKQDEEIAKGFVNAFIEDFPNTISTCIYPQWENLAKANFAFNSASKTKEPLMIWQQTLKLVQSFNEFINVLLGYLLVTWRCALGKTYSTNVFQNAYGSKLNEFSHLTNGKDGAFSLIFQFANLDLRNAIAHEDIWLESDTNKVKYTAGRRPKQTYEMGVMELFVLAAMGANFGQAYLVAISSLIILEDGAAQDKSYLPSHLKQVYSFTPS